MNKMGFCLRAVFVFVLLFSFLGDSKFVSGSQDEEAEAVEGNKL